MVSARALIRLTEFNNGNNQKHETEQFDIVYAFDVIGVSQNQYFGTAFGFRSVRADNGNVARFLVGIFVIVKTS